MRREAKITSEGIKRVLRNYKPPVAFAEYLWNGFDALATRIEINYVVDELGNIEFISVKDNGTGIDTTDLSDKFDKFYDSEKSIQIQTPKHSSAIHGKNGVGRLTFFTFAHNAEWKTVFQKGEQLFGSILKISSANLKAYTNDSQKLEGNQTGTEVVFSNVKISESEFIEEILPYLRREFCWFLELNEEYEITVNGEPLDYSSLILDKENLTFNGGSQSFTIKYVQWKEVLNKEHSKYYFINDSGEEVYKEFTTLNKKGDHFYHSLYIFSSFFNDFDFTTDVESGQKNLFTEVKSDPEYKALIDFLTDFLRKKRKPYLREYAEKLVLS